MPKSLAQLPDSELLDVGNQLINAFTANPAAYGSTPAEIASFSTLRGTFDGSVTNAITKDAESIAATAEKNADRAPYIAEIRRLRDTAKLAGATEAQMAATSLPSGGEKAPPTATIPVGAVDTSQRLQHTISWTDAAAPDNKRRPRGALGVEIYLKLEGPPPTDQSQCTFLTLDSKTPYVVLYGGEDAGKMAHYLMRWRMRDDSTGPWAETISATITG